MDDSQSAPELKPCETPWEELRAGALRHYEEVSTAASHWSSVIPRAINYYFDNSEFDERFHVAPESSSSAPDAELHEVNQDCHMLGCPELNDDAELPALLDEVDRYCAKATEGPWTAFIKGEVVEVDRDNDTHNPVVHWAGFDSSAQPLKKRKADALFIAAARNAWPRLSRELRARLKGNNG